MIPLIALGAFLFTLVGGLVALRFRDRLHLILGFSAGAVVGVTFFDLLPETIKLIGPEKIPLATVLIAFGFVIYLIIDRTLALHSHQDHCDKPRHQHHERGALGALSLSLHSLVDGLAVGFAFQASPTIGLIVTAAILTHGFSDGINTVGIILKNTSDRKRAIRWLALDAAAPAIGILATYFIIVPQSTLAIILALFTGSFFYLGASDLLPESHHDHPTAWTTVATILGIALLFIITRFAGI
jgi:ZIP family zinc transporter